MKGKIQEFFALTEQGAQNVIRAARASFCKNLTFVLPPMLVFLFLEALIRNQLQNLSVYQGMLLLIAVLIYVFAVREYKKTYDVTYQEAAQLRLELARKIKDLPLSYFSTHNLSDLSQSLMMDVNNIELTISHALPEGIGFLGFFLLITVLMCCGNMWLGLCATLPVWGAMGVMLISKNVQQKNVTKYYNKLLDNANAFQDAFDLQQEIKSYSLQEEVRNNVTQKLADTEKVHIAAEFFMGILSSLIGMLPYLGPVLVATVGAVLYTHQSIDLLYYLGYLLAANALAHQYANLSEYILMIFFFEDSYRRMRALKAVPLQCGADQELTSFDIAFEQVRFGYADQEVIRGVTFAAKQNEVTAIVGPSGCGKTTLLRLLSRLYDSQDGVITIGGQNIQEIDTHSLFRNISIVFQNVELFNTSILENIRMGRKDASDEEVLAAAHLAQVDQFVERMPEGYQTQIGENGAKLSGGERQRISIARAFLKNAPILLLDEISASLDVENEMAIQNGLNQLIQNKTVIIISHRMKSIENADRILVMNEGKIENTGKHQDLLQTSALYREMVKKSRQAEEYLY